MTYPHPMDDKTGFEATDEEMGLSTGGLFFHSSPKPDACQHDFQGWREFEDGNGGEQVCTKCGIGAMAYSLHASG